MNDYTKMIHMAKIRLDGIAFLLFVYCYYLT
jgi:hypothetical protein